MKSVQSAFVSPLNFFEHGFIGFNGCLLRYRYCLPDSFTWCTNNPETSSRVTLASLGIVFQTKLVTTYTHLCFSYIFRSIPVHFYRFFSYFCTGNNKITSTSMAGTVKDMSLIKQVACTSYCNNMLHEIIAIMNTGHNCNYLM